MKNMTRVSDNLAAMQKKFAAAAAKEPETGFLPILKFVREGEWQLGKDRDEITLGTRFVIRATSMQEGWIGWQNGKVVGEKMRPVSGVPIDDITLEPISKITKKDGWQEQKSFEGKFLNSGTDAVYKTTTHGGKQIAISVLHAIVAQMTVYPTFPNPVVELGAGSYTHPEHGKTYKPELEIIDWMAVDSAALLSETDDAVALPMMEEGEEEYIDPDDLY